MVLMKLAVPFFFFFFYLLQSRAGKSFYFFFFFREFMQLCCCPVSCHSHQQATVLVLLIFFRELSQFYSKREQDAGGICLRCIKAKTLHSIHSERQPNETKENVRKHPDKKRCLREISERGPRCSLVPESDPPGLVTCDRAG